MPNYSDLFDSEALKAFDRQVLADFSERRERIEAFLKTQGSIRLACPSCGYPTIDGRGDFDICSVCDWEDDGQDDDDADDVRGGPNSDLSLIDSRLRIGTFLVELARKMGGTINSNPMEVLQAVREREEVLDRFRNRHIRRDTHRDDRVGLRYAALRRQTLACLIKRL
ncbi:MAG TPA: CPCC family cysteine-rich protein [Stellaceae bacterium]|nr:CPCC family cysteine-rich protein [Stellaceae bacterium]